MARGKVDGDLVSLTVEQLNDPSFSIERYVIDKWVERIREEQYKELIEELARWYGISPAQLMDSFDNSGAENANS